MVTATDRARPRPIGPNAAQLRVEQAPTILFESQKGGLVFSSLPKFRRHIPHNFDEIKAWYKGDVILFRATADCPRGWGDFKE